MAMLEGVYVLILAGVSIYLVLRERPSLSVTWLMLMSFLVFYGIGHFVYYAGAETVEAIHARVTLSLILTWIALLIGIELARASWPRLSELREVQVSKWRSMPLSNPHPVSDGLLLIVGLAAGLLVLGVFFAMGKPGQLVAFASIDSAIGKQGFRFEAAGGGGYIYQTLIASVGPFLSILLLAKARAGAGKVFLLVGGLLAVAVLAGKLGTFHKIPWLIFLVQLLVARQMVRRLDLDLSRMMLLAGVVVFGSLLAAAIALPELDSVGLLQWLGYRFFEINNEVLYQAYYVYPDHLRHTWGMNIGLVHRIFAEGPLVSAHTQVANFFGAFGATFDPFFVGDAWVDFSYPGVFLIALMVGFTVKALDLQIASLGKSPLAIALTAGSLYGVFQLQVTSAFTAFLSGGLLLVPLATLLFSSALRSLKASIEASPPRRPVAGLTASTGGARLA
jgi:hypothetical protein